MHVGVFLAPQVLEVVLVGLAVEQEHAGLGAFEDTLIGSALPLGGGVADGEDGVGVTVAEVAAEECGAVHLVLELVLLLGQQDVEPKVGVGHHIFAVHVKHLVGQPVGESQVLDLAGPASGIDAEGCDGQGQNKAREALWRHFWSSPGWEM